MSTVAEIAGGTAFTASVPVAFPAQTAGTLLLLAVSSDDYVRTEPVGWTKLAGQESNMGAYVWWRIADGSETSVTYATPGAYGSSYTLLAVTGIDAADPLGANGANVGPVSSSQAQWVSPSITPAAGSWRLIASMHVTGNNTTGPYAYAPAEWSKVSERYITSGYRPSVGTATRVVDDGSPQQVTQAWAANGDQGIGIIAAWREATGGGDPQPVGYPVEVDHALTIWHEAEATAGRVPRGYVAPAIEATITISHDVAATAVRVPRSHAVEVDHTITMWHDATATVVREPRGHAVEVDHTLTVWHEAAATLQRGGPAIDLAIRADLAPPRLSATLAGPRITATLNPPRITATLEAP